MIYNPVLLTPTKSTIRGSDCTGSDGTTNRTYTITSTPLVSNSVSIIINGTGAHYTADWSISGNIITFLDAIYDTDYIDIDYLISWGFNNGFH